LSHLFPENPTGPSAERPSLSPAIITAAVVAATRRVIPMADPAVFVQSCPLILWLGRPLEPVNPRLLKRSETTSKAGSRPMKYILRSCISQTEIASAVEMLAARISRDYADRPLTIIGVLTGSVVFLADLMRQISIPHQIGMIQASSYRGTATSPEKLRINLDFLPELRDRDVLLVDDIFDTGRTISALMEQLAHQEPHSIHSAVLLWKTSRREVNAVPDYHCFQIPDQFVVGYGLDFNHQYRHLPYLGVLEPASSEQD